MPFLEILPVERVRACLDVPDKATLLDTLARILAGSPDDIGPIRDALVAREALVSTGLGHGVAIPHGRLEAVPAPRAAFVRLAAPIEFGAIDGKPVDLVAALVVPSHFTDQHLTLLAEFAEMFSDSGVTGALREAGDAATLRSELATFSANRVRGP